MGAIYPVAGNMAMAFFLLTLLALSQKRWPAFGVYAGLAFVTHKALWFALLPLLAITFVRHRDSRPFVVLSLLPVTLVWVAGTVYLGDARWMVSYGAKNLMWSPGALPVFDGLVTSFLSASAPKLVKGILVLGILFIAAVSLYQSLRHRFWLGVPICISTIAMTAVLNQHAVLDVVHFSRPLLIPAAYLSTRGAVGSGRWTSRALVYTFILGVVTNLGFAVYMTAYFFQGPGETP
jgi:hypothetical protein